MKNDGLLGSLIAGLLLAMLLVGSSRCAHALGSSFHTIAQLKSGPIPEQVLAGGKVWCVIIGPNGAWQAPPISNYCWAGFITAAGIWTIKAYSWETGEMTEGSAFVPGSECVAGPAVPVCTIPLEILP